MASIKKRADGKWRARYRDPAGREHAKHFERRVDAERWLDQVRGDLARGAYIDPDAGRQTFHAFATEWANAQDWKDSTRDAFPLVLARLESVLPRGIALRQVDQLAIKRARVALAERYATRTVDLTVGYLRSIMRAAFNSRRIGNDPTIGTQSRRRAGAVERVGPDEVPTRAEVAAMWQAAPTPYRAAIALGATG